MTDRSTCSKRGSYISRQPGLKPISSAHRVEVRKAFDSLHQKCGRTIESGGGIEKIRGIGWGEQSGPPMRHGPTLERPIDARGGDTVHGFIRAPISGSFQTTWLSFTPRSETTDPVDPEWPDDYSWIIDGGPEQ